MHWRNVLSILILTAILCVGLLLRVNIFDVQGSDYFHVDVARDYLIASHIHAYQELPLVGPDSFLGAHANSPVYYYIIAALLSLQDHVLFPGLFNVLLQTVAIAIVFLIAKEMFGKSTALISAFLFAVSDGVVTQSMQMWQPYLMQFFLLCSYLALLYGYRTGRLSFIASGAALCAWAATIHNAVWAVVPLYALAIAVTLRTHGAKTRAYIITATAFFFVFFCAYLPNIYLALTEGSLPVIVGTHFSLIAVVSQTFLGVSHLYTYLLEGSLQGITLYSAAFIVMTIGGSLHYLAIQKNTQHRLYFMYLLGLMLSTIAIVGFLSLPEGGFPVRYFVPVYAVFFILFSELLMGLFRQTSQLLLPLLCLVVLFVGLTSSEYVRSRFEAFPARIAQAGWEAFYPQYAHSKDIDVLAKFIHNSLREIDGQIRPFNVRTFQRGSEDIYANALVWVPLERMLGQRLVRITTHTFRGYSPMHDPEVLFVRCIEMNEQDCLSLFNEVYGGLYQMDAILETSERVLYIYAQKAI